MNLAIIPGYIPPTGAPPRASVHLSTTKCPSAGQAGQSAEEMQRELKIMFRAQVAQQKLAHNGQHVNPNQSRSNSKI